MLYLSVLGSALLFRAGRVLRGGECGVPGHVDGSPIW